MTVAATEEYDTCFTQQHSFPQDSDSDAHIMNNVGSS